MSELDELSKLAIATAFRKMFSQSYFDICTVDQCLKLAGVIAPRKPYQILHTLHCVHYSDMPRELAEKIPELLRQCFDGLSIEALMEAATPAQLSNGSHALRRLQ